MILFNEYLIRLNIIHINLLLFMKNGNRNFLERIIIFSMQSAVRLVRFHIVRLSGRTD